MKSGTNNGTRDNSTLRCNPHNNDAKNLQISNTNCSETCAQTSRYNNLTWTIYNSGTCWIKYGPVSRNDAIAVNDQSVMCGIADPVGTPGETTRNWNCCKPSCAWPGKVHGRDTYVKTCSKNGNDSYDNLHVASGCDEDDAYQ